MPTQDWGVYPDSLTLGTEVSSTYEGRHITATAAELNHGNILAVVTKGYPVIFDIVAGAHGVGVAFNTEVAGTDLIAVDTEGIWNLSVVSSDDAANSLVVAGDPLYINTTTAIISKIRNNATQIPFGYALSQGNGDGLAHTIAVKVHWDPRSHWLEDLEMLYFGDARDVSVEWDPGIPALEMLPLVNNTGAFNIGDGTFSMDFQVFGPDATQSMLYDSDMGTLDIVDDVVDADATLNITCEDSGTHTGDANGIHVGYTKMSGAITGAGAISAINGDVQPRADCSHVYAFKAYTGIADTPTVGDMSAFYTYCDNLGATAGNFGEYEAVNLNMDNTNPASATAQGNSFFRLYSHGGVGQQIFVIPGGFGSTYLFNWTALIPPCEAFNAAGNGVYSIAILHGGVTTYLHTYDAP